MAQVDDSLERMLLASPADLARIQVAEHSLSRLLQLARERDPTITREQVRERLIKHRPDLKELLPR